MLLSPTRHPPLPALNQATRTDPNCAKRRGRLRHILLLHQLPAMHDDDLRYRWVGLPESGLSRVGRGPAGKVVTPAPASMKLL
jgi:hypothetical protein